MSTGCKIIEQEIHFWHSPKKTMPESLYLITLVAKPCPHSGIPLCTCGKALSPLGDTPLHLLQSPVPTREYPFTLAAKPCPRSGIPLYTCCKALSPLGNTPLHLLQNRFEKKSFFIQ